MLLLYFPFYQYIPLSFSIKKKKMFGVVMLDKIVSSTYGCFIVTI